MGILNSISQYMSQLGQGTQYNQSALQYDPAALYAAQNAQYAQIPYGTSQQYGQQYGLTYSGGFGQNGAALPYNGGYNGLPYNGGMNSFYNQSYINPYQNNFAGYYSPYANFDTSYQPYSVLNMPKPKDVLGAVKSWNDVFRSSNETDTRKRTTYSFRAMTGNNNGEDKRLALSTAATVYQKAMDSGSLSSLPQDYIAAYQQAWQIMSMYNQAEKQLNGTLDAGNFGGWTNGSNSYAGNTYAYNQNPWNMTSQYGQYSPYNGYWM